MIKVTRNGTEEFAWWLKALASLLEDPRFDSLYPHEDLDPFVMPLPGGIQSPFWSQGTAHTWFTVTWAKHSYT